MYSINSAKKVSLFRDCVLAVLLSVVCSLLSAMPAAYAADRYALEFDGVDDYVDVPTTEYIFEDEHVFTIELWARWFDDTRSLCSYRYTVQRSRFRTRGSEALRVNTQIQDDEWHHVAVVYDGSGNTKYLDLYVDGVQTDSANTTGSPLSTYNGNTLRFGMTRHSGGEYSNCIMDEVRIWNKGRAPSEIQEYMNRGLSGSEEGLVGYWKFDEGEGTTAYNSSPNQNHGTLVGATWTADASPVVSFVFLLAYSPDPASGATDVPRDVVLSWTPGEFADKHDVYFGTNFNDVNDADRTNPRGVLVSQNHVPNNYSPAEVLQWEQTYYWRVDEVNGPPDYTVFEGSVWQFTAEPVAYPIENITATASSAHQADMGPENTINGSGLDADDLHSTQETAMWLSSMAGPQPTWIEFQLDGVYKLHQMWVWNSNRAIESLLGMGLKDVAIEYSTNGTDYTALGTTVEFAQAPSAAGYAHNTTVDLGGVAAQYVRLTANSNWGGFMPQYGLSEVRFLYIPVHATEPNPDSGATDVDVDVTLGWRTGRGAVEHHLYLSSDEQAVIDSNVPVTITTETSYGPLSLDLDMTYYWKINEVNMAETPTTWESNIWSFTTQQYLVVDDFESYNDLDPTDPDSKRIFNVWIDGFGVATNGSLVGYEMPPFCEQTIVHGGKQAMPFFYDNSGTARYSEAELTLSPAQDWTKYGIKGLTLRFCGDLNNAAHQLYVKLNGVKVEYDGAAENLQQSGWQMWYIDLASSGADISNVSTLSIGLERDGAAGGAGTLLIDSIRLYSRERQLVMPVEPNAAGLVGHYKLDGNASDSAGTNHGTEQGTPVYEPAGKFGQAINLDGTNDYVELPTGLVDSDIGSVTLWFKTTQSSFGHMFYGGVETNGNGWGPDDELHVSVLDDGGIHFFINGSPTSVGIGSGLVNNDTWTHVAATWDKSSGANLYVNGLMVGSAVHTGNSFSLTGCLRLGRPGDSGRYYSGLLDDVRIYDRVLSADEIAGLGGVTVPYDKPF